jgi:hypothetical protein
METFIINQRSTHSDLRKAAEDFVEKVVAPRRQQPNRADETVRARGELALGNRQLAREQLQRSGFDVAALDALAAERSKMSEQLAGQAHRRAIDGSAAAAQRLAALGPVIPPPLIDVSLDEVTFIRSFADEGAVVDSNVAPGDNWARYKLDASGDAIARSGTGRLSFFTLWQNPKSRVVTVMTAAQLMVNAHLSLHANFGGIAAWTFGDSYARATVRARTTVWSMDSSNSSVVADQLLGDASAQGGFFADDADSSIAFNDVLSGSGVAVPKNAYVLIEVELHTDWTSLDGEIHLDAQSGSFKVSLPQLALTVI